MIVVFEEKYQLRLPVIANFSLKRKIKINSENFIHFNAAEKHKIVQIGYNSERSWLHFLQLSKKIRLVYQSCAGKQF